MKPDVYFFTARTETHKQSMSKVKGPLALKNIGFEEKVKKDNNIVIKSHFGAEGNVRYLRPSYIRFLSDYVKSLGGNPTIAESCGWGIPGAGGEYGGRATEEEYLKCALQHGFTKETMGAPIIMLDGPIGIDHELQQINGKLFNEIQVAGRLREFDWLVMATHFKGHGGTGFGGAIKNLGIGCVTKGGKVEAHTGKKFEFINNNCSPECQECVKICPTKALSKTPTGELIFEEDKCVYCYMCNSVCKFKAINIGGSSPEDFVIQMVDNAKGVVDYFGKEKIFYVNYAIDITYQCDCCGGSDVPFVNDIGILSSTDPVALDQACIDLVHLCDINPHAVLANVDSIQKQECTEWFAYTPRYDETGDMNLNTEGNISNQWKLQLSAAEEIGLGSRDYKLIEVVVKKKS